MKSRYLIILALLFLAAVISLLLTRAAATAAKSATAPTAAEFAIPPLAATELIFDNEFYLRGDPDGEFKFLSETYNRFLSNAGICAQSLATFDKKTLSKPIALPHNFASGAITEWLIAGTFGKFDRASLFEEFAPEREINLTEPMDAKMGKVKWQKISAPTGDVKPHLWLEDERGIIYLFTQFYLDQPLNLWFNVETSGVLRLWLDDTEINTPHYNGGVNEFGAPIKLPRQPFSTEKSDFYNFHLSAVAAGWHRLLLKIYPQANAGENNFKIRLCAERSALTENNFTVNDLTKTLKFSVDEIQARATAITPENLKNCAIKAGTVFTLTTEGELNNSSPLLASATFDLMYRQQNAQALRGWEIITERLPRNAAAWARRGTVEMAATFLPTAKREAAARQSFLTALQLDPQCVPALLALGAYEHAKKRYGKAREFFARALAVNPRSLPALAAMAELPLAENWDEGEKYLLELEKLYPASYAALNLRALYAEQRRDFPAAYAALKKLLLLDGDNPRLLANFAAMALLTDHAADALAELKKLPAALNETPLVRGIEAQLLSANNQLAAAEKLFLHIAATTNSATAWENVGKIRLKQNEVQGAATAFAEVLSRAPQQHHWRQLHAELVGENYAFWEANAIAVPETIKNFEKRTPPAGRTARLIDQTIVQLYPDNSLANYTHGLQAVLNDGGIKSAAQLERVGELLRAQTILPERGLSLEPILLDDVPEILMPAVGVGAFVEQQYLQREPARALLRFPQWYFRSPNREEAFMYSQYVVRVPPNMAFNYATRNLGANVEFSETATADGTKILQWTAKDMERAIHEAGGLAIDETLPFVKISSHNSWAEINLLLANYYLGKTYSTPTLRAATAEILQNAVSGKQAKVFTPHPAPLTRAEKAQAILSAVNHRLEATSFNAPAAHLWEQRSGDRNLPLIAMLEIADLNPRLAAVRPPKNLFYDPIWELPEPDVFTHFLVVIDDEAGNKIWLDTRARAARAGELTEDLAGGTAFIIDPQNGGEFLTLPSASPENYTTSETRTSRLCPCATQRSAAAAFWQVNGKITLNGFAALDLQETLADAGSDAKRSEIVEEILGLGLPAVELLNVTTEGENTGASLTLNYQARLTLSDILQTRVGDLSGLPLGLPPLPLLPNEDVSNRKTAYHLSRFVAENNVYRFFLPPTAKIQPLPAPLILRTEFGTYQLSFKEHGDHAVEVRRMAHFPPQRIPPNKWKSFYDLARQINDREQQLIWWKNGSPHQ